MGSMAVYSGHEELNMLKSPPSSSLSTPPCVCVCRALSPERPATGIIQEPIGYPKIETVKQKIRRDVSAKKKNVKSELRPRWAPKITHWNAGDGRVSFLWLVFSFAVGDHLSHPRQATSRPMLAVAFSLYCAL